MKHTIDAAVMERVREALEYISRIIHPSSKIVSARKKSFIKAQEALAALDSAQGQEADNRPTTEDHDITLDPVYFSESLECILNEIERGGDVKTLLKNKIRYYKEITTEKRGQEAEGWLDISSAPRDGTEILIYRSANYHKKVTRGRRVHYAVAKWDNGYWRGASNIMLRDDVTHWQPLPAPPKTADSKEG